MVGVVITNRICRIVGVVITNRICRIGGCGYNLQNVTGWVWF